MLNDLLENYFYLDKKKSKKFSFIFKIVLSIFIIVLILFTGIYSVGEQEQAVITTFGKPTIVSTPGLKFKIPFIQKMKKINTTIQGFPIGYDMETKNFIEDESLMITSDYNFVNVDFYLEYKIVDPIKALYQSKQPALILKTLAQSYIRDTIGTSKVDDVITTGKGEIQAEIKTKIMERLEQEDIGIQLINISIQDAQPPTTEVINAFKAVETAKQDKETTINQANKYKSQQLPKAEAQIDETIKIAEATKEARINEANGQVARFNSMYEEYMNYPLITKKRMFYETMEEILPNLKIVIDSGSSNIEKFLPLEQLTKETITIPTETQQKGEQ